MPLYACLCLPAGRLTPRPPAPPALRTIKPSSSSWPTSAAMNTVCAPVNDNNNNKRQLLANVVTIFAKCGNFVHMHDVCTPLAAMCTTTSACMYSKPAYYNPGQRTTAQTSILQPTPACYNPSQRTTAQTSSYYINVLIIWRIAHVPP